MYDRGYCIENALRSGIDSIIKTIVLWRGKFLLSYPDENSFDPEQEARFLAEKSSGAIPEVLIHGYPATRNWFICC